MNYLAQNLHNCFIGQKHIPYDIMKDIYEYADPLYGVRQQIENNDYDLSEIMYQRMKKHIFKHITPYRPYYLYTNGANNMIEISHRNIHDRSLKDKILYWNCGYKNMNFHHRPRMCNLELLWRHTFRYEMIKALNFVKPEVNYDKRSTKRIYRLWRKL